jgi:hypothetical protein
VPDENSTCPHPLQCLGHLCHHQHTRANSPLTHPHTSPYAHLHLVPCSHTGGWCPMRTAPALRSASGLTYTALTTNSPMRSPRTHASLTSCSHPGGWCPMWTALVLLRCSAQATLHTLPSPVHSPPPPFVLYSPAPHLHLAPCSRPGGWCPMRTAPAPPSRCAPRCSSCWRSCPLTPARRGCRTSWPPAAWARAWPSTARRRTSQVGQGGLWVVEGLREGRGSTWCAHGLHAAKKSGGGCGLSLVRFQGAGMHACGACSSPRCCWLLVSFCTQTACMCRSPRTGGMCKLSACQVRQTAGCLMWSWQAVCRGPGAAAAIPNRDARHSVAPVSVVVEGLMVHGRLCAVLVCMGVHMPCGPLSFASHWQLLAPLGSQTACGCCGFATRNMFKLSACRVRRAVAGEQVR